MKRISACLAAATFIIAFGISACAGDQSGEREASLTLALETEPCDVARDAANASRAAASAFDRVARVAADGDVVLGRVALRAAADALRDAADASDHAYHVAVAAGDIALGRIFRYDAADRNTAASNRDLAEYIDSLAEDTALSFTFSNGIYRFGSFANTFREFAAERIDAYCNAK